MRLAHLQLALAMAIAGANVAVAKAAGPFLPAFIFALVRFVIAALVLLPLAWREPGPKMADLSWDGWRDLFLQALFGVLLYMLFLLYGLQYTSAVSAGIITSTVPAAVALLAVLAVLMLGDRLGFRQAFALGLAVLGILAVNTAGAQPEIAPNPLLGNVLIAGTVISEGLFTIYAKRVGSQLPVYRMAFATTLIGFALTAPFSAYALVGFDASAVPLWVWTLPVIYAVTSCVIALVLWYRGLAGMPASEAAIFTATYPLAAVAASLIFLGEPLQWAHGLGLICVLAAIVLHAGRRPRTVRA